MRSDAYDYEIELVIEAPATLELDYSMSKVMVEVNTSHFKFPKIILGKFLGSGF